MKQWAQGNWLQLGMNKARILAIPREESWVIEELSITGNAEVIMSYEDELGFDLGEDLSREVGDLPPVTKHNVPVSENWIGY